MTAIVLAAGIGRRLWPLTADRPKCLLPLPLMGGCTFNRLVLGLEMAGIDRLACVVGHLRGQVRRALEAMNPRMSVHLVVNERYRLGSILSLNAARDFLDDDVVVLDADVLLPLSMISRLVRSSLSNAFLLDPGSKASGEEMMLMVRRDRVWNVGRNVEGSWDLLGESLGLLKLNRSASCALRDGAAAILERPEPPLADYEEAYRSVLEKHEVGFLSVAGEPWTEIDTPADLATAAKSVAPRIADRELRGACFAHADALPRDRGVGYPSTSREGRRIP